MPTTPGQSSSRPINFARLELLVASHAAARWPPGRDRYSWFTDDEAEKKWHDTVAYRVPVNIARTKGDPAVAVAALRAVRQGRDWIEWRGVWIAQTAILKLLELQGVKLYNDLLSEDPIQVASLFKKLAEEVR